jgi:tyrosine-protein phosphatase YwqE
VFNWFKEKTVPARVHPLTTDLHSHLLPGLDDGVSSLEQAEEIINRFVGLGYKKIITTPHVMYDYYRNSPKTILPKLKELQAHIETKKIDITLQAAAEYNLDENLMRLVQGDEPLLTLGNNYLLFETTFFAEPLQLKEFIFLATTKGYKLILAHPERYVYLQNDLTKAEDLLDRGVLFQININSLAGMYDRGSVQAAQKLIERGWVHFMASDCHTLQHMEILQKTINNKYFQKALSLPLLNNTL